MRHELSASNPDHEELLHRLYEAAAVDLRGSGESFRMGSGKPATWALDLRRPLLTSSLLAATAGMLAAHLAERGVTQVAGRGMGAAPLVCAVVAQGTGIDGVLVRERPKERGFARPYEGALDAEREVWLLDDVVNSGKTTAALALLLRAEGFAVHRSLCLFHYAWGDGRARLRRHGVELEPLATLARRDRSVFSRKLLSRFDPAAAGGS
ncbi:MAG TPA: orotate phosphoribosyltransferase [Thermoanaerobaculia bacterium]|nr:orotate phosphoribosyltransferase [Thermoanaerobaculia bacterium]